MKISIPFILLWVVLATAAVTAAAQAEPISESDYNSAMMKSLLGASSRDRTIITEETFYTGTQATGTRRIVSDFMGDNAKRIDVVEDFNGKKTRSNSITLNGQFFCKDGDKAWKRADKECAKAGSLVAIPDGEYDYFVEPDVNVPGRKIYTRRASYSDSGIPERDAARLKFIEIKFVTDDSGLILEYSETRRGGIEPNGWSSTHFTRYEYDPPGLKITAPSRRN